MIIAIEKKDTCGVNYLKRVVDKFKTVSNKNEITNKSVPSKSCPTFFSSMIIFKRFSATQTNDDVMCIHLFRVNI